MSAVEQWRLFIGHPLEDALSMLVREATQPLLADRRWRVTAQEQWHLTVLFIGDRPVNEVPSLTLAIGEACRQQQAIKLHNGKLVSMPERHPSMLWLRFDPDPAFEALHQAFAGTVDLPADRRRPFWPHATLARAKDAAPAIQPSPIVLPELLIDHLVFFRSVFHPSGAVHSRLGNWPLRSIT